MTQYRKKPVVIEAMQFTDETKDQCYNFVRCNTQADFEDGKPVLRIQTSEGIMTAKIGDYIIKEPFATPDRQFYPCKPGIFEATYEKVEIKQPQAQELTTRFYDDRLTIESK